MNTMKIRYFFILLFFLFTSSIARGGSVNFCKLEVTGETGKGKVYASSDPALMEVPEYYDSYTTPTTPTFRSVDEKVFYLYAKPESGYNFVTWKKGNTQIGQFPYVCDNFPYLRYNVTGISSDDKTSPTSVPFSATFSSTWVTLSNPYPTSVCNAYINPLINSNGTSVTLTANVSSNTNSTWVGWRDIHTGEIVSTSLSYTFTVDKKMDLEPVIKSSVFNNIPDGFYCIKSAVSNSDGKALELISNEFCLQAVVGSVSSFDEDQGITRAQTQLRKDLVLSDVSQATPAGSVMYLKYMGNNTYELFSQGVNLKKVTSGTHHGSNAGDADYEGSYLTITDKGNGKYGLSIYIAFSVSFYSVAFTLNLKDKGDGQLYMEKTDDEQNEWSIEPIATPIKTITTTTLEDIKYTSLRSDFSYVIPNGSSTKAYKVKSISDGLASLVEYEQGDTIYAGTPSILSYPSSESLNIIPVGNPLFKNNVTNVVLYNNYGTHKHDETHPDAAGVTVRDGGEPRGDKIGYFAKETYSGTLYRLSVDENNVVGFWTPVNNSKISGNEAFATQPCALVKDIDIKDLPDAHESLVYHVTTPLTVAYVDKNGVIYAKDNNGATEQAPVGEEEDFMALHYSEDTYGDHSNWLAIESNTVPTLKPSFSRIETTGKLIEATPNRRFHATRIDVLDEEGDFYPNTYCIVNFMPKSSHSTTHHNFFFAAPQANEIVQIIWAQWDGNNFIVPPSSGFTGAITVDFSLYNGSYTLTEGNQYKFLALIEKSQNTKDASNLYKVYPLEGLTDVTPTGVQNVTTQGEVINVRYYNLAGVASDQPFDGINIVVTTFSDGSKQAVKVLH